MYIPERNSNSILCIQAGQGNKRIIDNFFFRLQNIVQIFLGAYRVFEIFEIAMLKLFSVSLAFSK